MITRRNLMKGAGAAGFIAGAAGVPMPALAKNEGVKIGYVSRRVSPTCAEFLAPARTAATGSVRSSPSFIRSPTTARSASSSRRSAVSPIGRRTSTSSSRRTASTRLTTDTPFRPPHINSGRGFGVKQSRLAEFKRIEDPATAKKHGFSGPFPGKSETTSPCRPLARPKLRSAHEASCRRCRHNRLRSAQTRQSRCPHHPGGAGRLDPRGLCGRRFTGSHPCPQPRRKSLVRQRVVRKSTGRREAPLPRNDRPVFDGRPRTRSERPRNVFEFKPDMASLATGSVNFPTIVYENSALLVRELAARMREFRIRPEIEIFDLSHIHGARRLIDEGLIDDRPHVQFVLGIQNATPAEEPLLDILLRELKRVLPKATWTAAGIGRHQAPVMDWALARGADAVRTGLEDNVRMSKDRLAKSNAELVEAAAAICAKHGAQPATSQEARALLGLSQAQ